MTRKRFLFACPHCKETYTTQNQAVKCGKNVADHFQVGNVVRYHGNVWLIASMKNGAANLEKIPSYRLAFGWQDRRDTQSRWFWQPVARFCGQEMQLVNKKDAKKQLDLRTKQAKAAQEFFSLFDGKGSG